MTQQEKNNVTPKTAIIADAGMATRFLPATKVVPKSLLPVGNLPTLLWNIREAKAAGAKKIIVVTNARSYDTIKKFLSEDKELYNYLERNNKLNRMYEYEEILGGLSIDIVIQNPQYKYGTAAPLLSVEKLLSDEPFMYMFADDITLGKDGIMRSLVDAYNQYKNVFKSLYAVIAVQPIEWDQVHKYGVVKYRKQITEYISQMEMVIEKPNKEEAPSNHVSYGRYLIDPQIFEALNYDRRYLDTLPEYWIQPALTKLAEQGVVLTAFDPKITWYTTGDPVNMYKAWEAWYKTVAK